MLVAALGPEHIVKPCMPALSARVVGMPENGPFAIDRRDVDDATPKLRIVHAIEINAGDV